jgi:hypothetical protein
MICKSKRALATSSKPAKITPEFLRRNSQATTPKGHSKIAEKDNVTVNHP